MKEKNDLTCNQKNTAKITKNIQNPSEPILELADNENDPAVKEVFLQTAQTVSEQYRQILATAAQIKESNKNTRAFLESRKKKEKLPLWFVILVFVLFFAALAHIIVKHYL